MDSVEVVEMLMNHISSSNALVILDDRDCVNQVGALTLVQTVYNSDSVILTSMPSIHGSYILKVKYRFFDIVIYEVYLKMGDSPFLIYSNNRK